MTLSKIVIGLEEQLQKEHLIGNRKGAPFPINTAKDIGKDNPNSIILSHSTLAVVQAPVVWFGIPIWFHSHSEIPDTITKGLGT